MNKKATWLLVIGSIIFTIILMMFGRHGSFNPREVGFYTSVGAGIIWFFGMYFVFKKLIKRRSKKENPDNH